MFCDYAKFFAYNHKAISDLKVFSINCFRIIRGVSAGTAVQDYFLCIDFLEADG